MELTTKGQRFGNIPPKEYKELFTTIIQAEDVNDARRLFDRHYKSHILPMAINYTTRFSKSKDYFQWNDEMKIDLTLCIWEVLYGLRSKTLDENFDVFYYVGHLLHFRSLRFLDKQKRDDRLVLIDSFPENLEIL